MQTIATNSTTPNRVTLWAALMAVYLLWGSTYLFVHFMTEQMPPLYMASVRFMIAGTLLYTYARLTGTPNPQPRQWLGAGIAGALLLTIANGCMTMTLQYIPTGMAALLGATLPVFLLTMNWIGFARARPTNLALLGLALGLLGVFFLIKPDKLTTAGNSHNNLIGAGLIVICNLGWASGTLLSPRLTMPAPAISSACQMLVAGVLLFVVSMIVEPATPLSILQAPPKALGSLIYLVIFGSMIGFSAYSWLAQNAPPQLVSTYAYVNPVVAVLLGATFAGETLSAQMVIGAAIVLAGVVLITTSKK
jgi:drug/metabolite transporter (DMT)-like permease